MLDRRLFLKFAAVVVATPPTVTYGWANAGRPVNTLGGSEGVAIRGYDPVAYFVSGGPRKGDPQFVTQHGGAAWRFASAENKALFDRDPARYLPAYGGFCAYGVSRGYLVKIEPEAWTIVDGRLYLNYDLSVQDKWRRDTRKYIAKADGKWPRLTTKDISA